MAKTRKLVVDILADASKFTSELSKTETHTKRLKGALTSLGKSMGIGLAAAAGGAAAFGISAIKAAEEAEQVQNRVAAIIKATGGVANVSAKQIDKFAASQMMLVGVDDEVLKKSYGILLTFKNVRNEAGKGNDIFNRTAKALADLAAAGFGDTDSAAKAMGKALQDPIKGITALSRAGITFSEDQKKMIKALVESGDLLTAQKIILGEVEGQVGGTAAAGVTGSEKMKLAFADLKEKIGTELLPVFNNLADVVTTKVAPNIEKFIKFLKKHPDVLKKAAVGVGALSAAIVGLNVVMWALSANPIVLIIAAIVLVIAVLVGLLVAAYFKFESVRKVVDAMKPGLLWLAETVGKVLVQSFTVALSWIDKMATGLNWLIAVATPVASALGTIFSNVFQGVANGLRTSWNFIVRAVNPILNKLKGVPGLGWLPDRLPEWPSDAPKTDGGGGIRRAFADGGIVTGPTNALIGEAGPEAVIPLSRAGAFGLNGGSTTININVEVSPMSNPAEVGQAVVSALKAYERRSGPLPLRVA